MNRSSSSFHFAPTALALALCNGLAVCASAQAQDEAPTPALDASISAGAGLLGGDRADRARFGQYNGLRQRGSIGLLDLNYYRRIEDGGTSIRVDGVNLLGETRELELHWKKPGDWKLAAGLSDTIRHEPQTPSSGDALQLRRHRLGLGLVKVIGPRLQFEANVSHEHKDGSRLFGIGMTCPSAVAPGCRAGTGTETGWALLMRPEPIDAQHSQLELRLSYAGEKLNLSGGYYGSLYRNAYGSFSPDVPASLNNPLGELLPLSAGLRAILNQPVALPPDNRAQQVDVTGTYAFTPTTRLNFKLAQAQALQHQDFAAAGLTGAPAGVTNLGGRIDTTLATLSLSARPLPRLSLLAKLRYEERDDRTPIALYNVEDTASFTNRQLPSTKKRGQLQATYQFSSDYRGQLGAEIESIDRGVFTASSAVAGISALRQKTDEKILRAELRRRLTEDISGAVSVESSRRDGSNWLRNNSGLGVSEVSDPSDPASGFATAIFMPTLANRQRDKLKAQADWQPSERLALQLSAQVGRDRFTTPSDFGLRRNGMGQFHLDVSYAWSEAWNLTGYLSTGHETLQQVRPAAALLAYTNNSAGLGLGLSGKPTPKIEVGAGLAFIQDKSVYAQTLEPNADGASVALLAASGGLPDILFRQARLTLFGTYALSKQSTLRLDLVYQHSNSSDWSWGYLGRPFSYSDGMTLSQPARQQVTFLGLRYFYRWN